MNNRSVLLVLVVVLLVGCSAPITTAPHVRAWQPWTRVSGELGSISPLSIQVDYQTDILPGADSLLCRDLEETIGSLLSRRGFEIRDEASSGKAIFASFRTERRDHIRTGMYNRATYRISYAKTDISTTTSTGETETTTATATESNGKTAKRSYGNGLAGRAPRLKLR